MQVNAWVQIIFLTVTQRSERAEWPGGNSALNKNFIRRKTVPTSLSGADLRQTLKNLLFESHMQILYWWAAGTAKLLTWGGRLFSYRVIFNFLTHGIFFSFLIIITHESDWLSLKWLQMLLACLERGQHTHLSHHYPYLVLRWTTHSNYSLLQAQSWGMQINHDSSSC